ncbi:carboxyl-terminal processing protease CtpA [Leptolyngbya sp. FACHB-711]|uniref:carboxyl-terminal processing protease CtpA n=1 Tax=unclassified Leptolyngbya TaxID=2650499 RepID=UPI001685B3DB|nr:PDZ domain-containing protein [Cyanobacteria bacterium FACHB-502]MBD2024586.1 PDZ domain-containing protein [Leptolyngbya sp. FACHB-711]
MRKQIACAGLVIGFTIGFAFMLATVLGGMPSAYAFTEEQRLVSEVWRLVDRAYVDDSFNHQNWWQVRQKVLQQPLQNREQTYTAIQKMLGLLDDPFTRLLKPDQYRSLQTNTSGELTGVGLQIAQENSTGELRVIAPIEGSPAAQAGIKPRDRIIKINGYPTVKLSLDEAAERMRGPAGSRVTLTIAQDGQEEAQAKDVLLVRDRITLNPVYAALKAESEETQVGYIRLSQFNANASSELAHAIRNLEQQGANAYVLDLRSNPGGLLQSGIDIAKLWLDGGTVVYTVNRNGIQDSFTDDGSALTDDPLVVLVNQGTASASEILAGALQDNGRAQLVGERTFGKGLIQSLFSLSDGSGLAVTIAKYETPNHHDINKQGIIPDIVVPLDPIDRDQIATAADRQYQAAVDLLTHHAVLAGAA